MPTQQELIKQRLAGGGDDPIRSLIKDRLSEITEATAPPRQIGTGRDIGFRDVIGPVLGQLLRAEQSRRTNFADRSVVSEAGARFARGTIQTQFTLPGNLLTMAGDLTGIDAVRDTGTFFRLAGALGTRDLPPSDPEGRRTRKFVGAVAEATPQFATQVAGSLILGPAAFIGLGVGPVVGDQYIETKERLLAEGAIEEEAIRDASVEAGIAGVITGVTNLLPAKVIPPNFRKPIEKSIRAVVKGLLSGAAAEATQETLERVMTDYSLAIKRQDFAAIKRIGTVAYWKELGFDAAVASVLGAGGKGASIAAEPDEIAQDQAEIIKTVAPEDPAEPLESPADAPTVLAPTEPPVIEPAVTEAVDGLDATQREVAEEAALDVLADEESSDADQQKAAQVVEALDQSKGPAVEEGVEVKPPTAAEKEAFLKGIGVDTSKKVQRTVTEKAALKGKLRGMRDVAAIVSRSVRATVKAAATAKGKIEKDTRVFVRRLIRSTVARDQQGRLLRLVENANPKTLENILDEIDLAIATDKVNERASEVKSLSKKIKKAKFISEAQRQAFLKELADAEGLAKGVKAFKQVESIDKASEAINDTVSDVAQEFATAVAAQKKIANGAYKNVRDTVSQLLKNIAAPAPTPLTEDEQTPTFRKGVILISDIRRLSNVVENIGKRKVNSILEKLLWRQMTRAHGEHELHMGDREGQLEEAAKAFGFSSLSDAFAQLSGSGGEALTQTVDVVIDGKEVTITMGQAMWFAAIDSETEARLLAGDTIVLSEGRKQKGFPVTADEIDAIRKKIPFPLRNFIRAAKGIAGQDTTILFETFLELNGREPRRVGNYFRRKRALQAAETAGKPKSWNDIRVQYNENLGIGKERSGSQDSPIIVEDFLTAILEQISDTSKVIHISKPIREASSVLFDPEVQAAINRNHGDDMNDALETYLGAASLARTNVTKLGEVVRFLNGSLAVAKLGLNPSSWLKQIGGLFRLMPILGFERMANGMANINSVTMKEMTDHSGFFLTRYIRNIVGRFSPIEEKGDKAFGADNATFSATLDRIVRNFLVGDFKAAFRAARDLGLSSLEFLNAFDGINARLAWAGYKYEIQQLHPEWTEGLQLLWVAEKAEDAIRESQNSSSTLDMNMAALNTRGKATSAWLLFSSDRMKTPNRIARGIQRGKGIETVAAEVLNSIWSVAVGRGVTLTTAVMVALALGDEDDIEEAFKRATKLDRNGIALGLEAVNMIDPLFTPPILESLAFNRAQVFDTAVGSSINDLVIAANDFRQSAVALGGGDYEKFREKLIKGGVGAALEVGALGGVNPLDVQMRRVLNAYDKLDDDEQRKLGRGDIP